VTIEARSEDEQVLRKQASSSILKALDLIDALASAGRPLTLSELSRQLGRPLPSVHRLLRTLELRNYVESFDGRYGLTLKLFEIGSSVISSIDVVAEARPTCERLCGDLDETVNMAVRSGTSAVYVMKLESLRSLRLISQLGMHVPLYCTAMGKVLLAEAKPHEQQAILAEITYTPRTKNTIVSRTALEDELASVKSAGYAVDNEEFDNGLICIAAPVFDLHGEIAAAISATGPSERFPRRSWPKIGRRVHEAGAAISERLGSGLNLGSSLTKRGVISRPETESR
jgi:DNA-binding IclR family transcriptional regulator